LKAFAVIFSHPAGYFQWHRKSPKFRVVMKKFLCLLCCVALMACTATPQQFATDRYSMSDGRLCRSLRDAEERSDYSFATKIRDETERRGLDDQKCDSAIKKQNIGAGIAILGAALIVSAASKGGGGGGGSGSYPNGGGADYDWAWDQFYGHTGGLEWRCRGMQTGQFAENAKCVYKPMNDLTWPSKVAP
jgi:hypothetical protein